MRSDWVVLQVKWGEIRSSYHANQEVQNQVVKQYHTSHSLLRLPPNTLALRLPTHEQLFSAHNTGSHLADRLLHGLVASR